jgi:hypothetical protein
MLENSLLRDERLSYRARGILAVILSNVDDWSITSEDLAAKAPEGRDAVRTALTELEAVGYLRREKRRGRDGRIATVAMVYDRPQVETRTEQAALFPQVTPGTDSPAPEEPAPGQPTPDSQAPTEEPLKKTPAPAGRGPADLIAAAVYERLDKMGNYMAIRQVAAQALRAKHPQESVQAAMFKLVDDSRPLTGQTVRDALKGAIGTTRDTHHDHWSKGGTFAQEGPTP